MSIHGSEQEYVWKYGWTHVTSTSADLCTMNVEEQFNKYKATHMSSLLFWLKSASSKYEHELKRSVCAEICMHGRASKLCKHHHSRINQSYAILVQPQARTYGRGPLSLYRRWSSGAYTSERQVPLMRSASAFAWSYHIHHMSVNQRSLGLMSWQWKSGGQGWLNSLAPGSRNLVRSRQVDIFWSAAVVLAPKPKQSRAIMLCYSERRSTCCVQSRRVNLNRTCPSCEKGPM
jgi:hypothetical protein